MVCTYASQFSRLFLFEISFFSFVSGSRWNIIQGKKMNYPSSYSYNRNKRITAVPAVPLVSAESFLRLETHFFFLLLPCPWRFHVRYKWQKVKKETKRNSYRTCTGNNSKSKFDDTRNKWWVNRNPQSRRITSRISIREFLLNTAWRNKIRIIIIFSTNVINENKTKLQGIIYAILYWCTRSSGRLSPWD